MDVIMPRCKHSAPATATCIHCLKEENKKLRECVELYADIKNWGIEMSFIDDDYINIKSIKEGFDYRGGKRARQCLKEIDKGLSQMTNKIKQNCKKCGHEMALDYNPLVNNILLTCKECGYTDQIEPLDAQKEFPVVDK